MLYVNHRSATMIMIDKRSSTALMPDALMIDPLWHLVIVPSSVNSIINDEKSGAHDAAVD